MSDGKEYKGQKMIIEGSRSGADIAVTKMSYNSDEQVEYIGEAKRGSSASAPSWYIEKIIYNSSELATDIKTAINKIYSGVITVDITVSGSNITIVMTGIGATLKSILNVKDQVKLTTATNSDLIQGIITSYDRSTDTIVVDVQGMSGIVNESGTVLGATDLIFTFNSPETKPFEKRVWELRSQYIYE